MSYSSGSGGTLTLPSPNSIHHVDVTAAVRSLRRSISRSPSKFNLVRAASQSSNGSLSSPNSPSPCRIIQRPMPPASAPHLSHQYPQSNLATPFRAGVKLSLRSGKPKAASAKPISRAHRVSPKSPIKRALSNTTDSGNSTLSSSPPAVDPLTGQENDLFGNFPMTLSPTSRKSSEKHHSRHSMHLDVSGASKNTFPRLFDFKADAIPANSISPLKRSDAVMNTDQAHLDNPVAKRRSLHGIPNFPIDAADIFDASSPTPQYFEILEDRNKEYELENETSIFRDNLASPTPAAMPRRSDSLRKSTLQQRQDDRSSWGRRQGEKHLAQIGAEASTPNTRNRPRVSLDQFVQPALSRDSPFSTQPPLPNPSLHMLDRHNAPPQPHPLSRSLTTSSSNSSIADDSPTHIPVQFDKPKAHAFAKSLPLGARPAHDGGNRNTATPAYKSARPLQDAFKSTGLISKVNRNPEKEPSFGGSKAVMPDTPCKKPIYPSNTYPPSSGGGKGRHRHSFGSPSSPFAPGRKDNNFVLGEPDKVASLFRPLQSGHTRKNSIFNFDSEIDPQSFADIEFPPTPTKSVLFRSLGNSRSVGAVGETPFARTMPAPVSAVGFRDRRPTPDPMCKLAPFKKSATAPSGADQMSLRAANTTAAPEDDPCPLLPESFLSFGDSRARQGSHLTPKPLKLRSITPTLSSQKKVVFAETAYVITASPLGPLDNLRANSPKTPCSNSNLMPPDPSSLSISNHEAPGNTTFGSFPPATPTSRQADHFGFADRRMSITPINGHGPSDVDMVLNSVFDHVELIGKGEFSQVFKATENSEQKSLASVSSTPGTPPTPSQARVFAVKKTRLPFFGAKDRESKLREVNTLKALRGLPHVLQYVESWEKQFHLYIQTEYCEEGSLSEFLGNVGSAGRLDDFRIWKILVEASMGLKSIHEAGFIHLDIKPANILINYEGSLKIGDFGLATTWPAARGIEGEGDRRYIAPEILQGKYDKPADVFALGLIMFEIASNVWLPDNGPHWLALREGNFSAVPTGPLTGSEADALVRDATGMPIVGDLDNATGVSPLPQDEHSISEARSRNFPFDFSTSSTHDASNLFGTPRRVELEHPPHFMVDPGHADSLDNIVQWMLGPEPSQRPSIQQVLDVQSIRWVTTHRRAGATVFEGNWGPQEDDEDDSQSDTVMTDA
ncbi:wee/wee-unclassified protein kinase [Diaporthe helianthi]|uniref:Wee/wee-unclassified protein kinase n=1 Tax=Diaporthe helianthi TaxID=158607 RepID=A0A2P5HP71_DIAHE|nr:wee/wee-unclassified protein kinase [Diaporthe helianthi]